MTRYPKCHSDPGELFLYRLFLVSGKMQVLDYILAMTKATSNDKVSSKAKTSSQESFVSVLGCVHIAQSFASAYAYRFPPY